MNVTVKVLKIKGMPTEKEDFMMLISSDACKNGGKLETKKKKGKVIGVSSEFTQIKKKELKKGAEFTFSGEKSELAGDICIEMYLPKGVSSVTYEITFEDSEGKEVIKSIKEKKHW